MWLQSLTRHRGRRRVGSCVCVRRYETIDVGMMGNAVWRGVRLSEVLEELFPWLADISPAHRSRLHVHFHGKDQYVHASRGERLYPPPSAAGTPALTSLRDGTYLPQVLYEHALVEGCGPVVRRVARDTHERRAAAAPPRCTGARGHPRCGRRA